MRGTEDRPRVLVLEDDADVAALISEVLNDDGFDTLRADEHTSTHDMARYRPRLILLDLILGSRRAVDVLSALRRSGLRGVPTVLVSGAVDIERQANALGAAALLTKPFDIDQLVATCRQYAM